ncbi:MAG: HIT family protein [Pseudomonadota bacterium]
MTEKTATYENDNIFAKILRGEIPCHNVYETDKVLAFMDIMPRSDGHTLVIPKAPCRNILDINPDDLTAVIQTVKTIGKAAITVFAAQGLLIQQFNEAASGQEVFHLHFHILPRQEGVELRPPGIMAEQDILAEHATKLRNALG